MKGLKFRLVQEKEGDTCLGYAYIHVIDIRLNCTEERVGCDQIKRVFYQYTLDCVTPCCFTQILEEELFEEISSGIYILDRS